MSIRLFHPRYWLLWLGIGFLRLLVLLPFAWQLKLGRGIGILAYYLAHRRRKIVLVNLKLCFPELNDSEHSSLAKASFKSAGMGTFETIAAWWMSDKVFAKIPIKIDGLESLNDRQQGILVCGAHFTCLELIGRKFAQMYPLDLVYRKHANALFEYMTYTCRSKYVKHCIDRNNVKAMVQSLRKGNLLWYAPDQDLGRDRSVFVSFFNVPTATLKATSWLAKAGLAQTRPAFFFRVDNNRAYEGHLLPALENFPSGDDEADARRYNELLEKFIREHKDQYLWQHRRFKTRPEGQASFYK